MALHIHKRHCERNFNQKVAGVAQRVGQGMALVFGIYETGKSVYGIAQAAAPYASPLLTML